MKGWRKVLILGMCIASLMIGKLYMEKDHYSIFATAVYILGSAAMASNAFSNYASSNRGGKTPDGKPYE